MIKRHLKSIAAPKTWPIKRKENKYATRPNAGKMFSYSLPLNIILKELTNTVKTTRETKYLLKEKNILVNGKKVNDIKYPIGMMDVLSLPEIDENYRLILTSKGKLNVIKIDKKESGFVISRIENKTKVKKKTQLNMIDSRNILVDKDEYKTGDSLVLNVPKQEISSVLKREKGAYAILLAGKYIGYHGVIENILNEDIIINLSIGKKIETLKKYAFVIGKQKPEIKLLD